MGENFFLAYLLSKSVTASTKMFLETVKKVGKKVHIHFEMMFLKIIRLYILPAPFENQRRLDVQPRST